MRDSFPGHPDYVERVTFEPHAVVVRHEEAVMVRTEFDDDGRPLRSLYPLRGEEERYRYDSDGRMTEILESTALRVAAGAGERDDVGGPLVVEHDARGPSAIRGEYETVWERVDEPWPALLGRGAHEIAEGLVDGVKSCGVAPGTEVFALSLTYVEQGGLHSVLSFGLEQDRRAWLAARLAGNELARKLWYLIARGGGLYEIERYEIPPELDSLLLREACLKQPADPYRAILHEVAALLARHDWNGLVTPTEDFVVFVAEHDEDITPKHDSVRAVNPADRLAAWDDRWPAGVTRGDDAPDLD